MTTSASSSSTAIAGWKTIRPGVASFLKAQNHLRARRAGFIAGPQCAADSHSAAKRRRCRARKAAASRRAGCSFSSDLPERMISNFLWSQGNRRGYWLIPPRSIRRAGTCPGLVAGFARRTKVVYGLSRTVARTRCCRCWTSNRPGAARANSKYRKRPAAVACRWLRLLLQPADRQSRHTRAIY